jgi:hypothetical protein
MPSKKSNLNTPAKSTHEEPPQKQIKLTLGRPKVVNMCLANVTTMLLLMAVGEVSTPILQVTIQESKKKTLKPLKQLKLLRILQLL